MEPNKITVLRIEPDKFPKVVQIDNDLESLQHEVDGNIEQYMPFMDEVALIVNEEGKLNGLKLNRAVYDEDTEEVIDIVAGTFLVVYAPYDTEYYESLPEDMITKYEKMFHYPEMFAMANNKLDVTPYTPLNEEE